MTYLCFECGKAFESARTDAVFCSGACKARYERRAGNAGKHVPLEQLHSKFCEHCGRTFWYNAYAKRGGKRQATYCSASCRKQAWAERKRSQRQRDQEAEDKRSWEAHRRKAQEEAPKTRPFQTGDFRDTLPIPRHWTHETARDWLGVPRNADFAVSRAAFRALNAKYHPDHNNGVEWPHLKTVNAAWDFLKRNRSI